jgi:hypothetical protein
MRGLFSVVVLVTGAVVGASAGCGKDSVKLDDLPGEANDAICEWFVQCGAVESADYCTPFLPGGLNSDLQAGVDNGSIAYDAEAAADCLSDIAGASCDLDDQGRRDLFASDDCDGVFTGTVAEGGDCYIDEQCVSEVCAALPCPQECCLGACAAAAAPVGVGESCLSAKCVTEAYCDDFVCAPLEAQGSPCSDDDNCQLGLACFSLGDGPSTCQPLPAEGEACDTSFFGFGGCNSLGLVCDPATGTCETWLFLGDACGPGSTRCSPYYLTCDAETNTCALLPDVGEPCVEACRGDLYCDYEGVPAAGVCAARKADGASCTDDSHCVGDTCTEAGLCGTDPSCV